MDKSPTTTYSRERAAESEFFTILGLMRDPQPTNA